MIKQIRNSKATKIVACYLILMIFLETMHPLAAYALTEGPSQPEFNTFTPIGTSDMVDLASGDLNYNIPIMDVGGYPINLSYNSGVTMDQEASWVGLGWNLNVGQINRDVRGLPDDFKGDKLITQNNMKPNVTIGASGYANVQIIGFKDGDNIGLKFGAGLDLQSNNYSGMSAIPSFGPTFALSRYVSVGMQLSASSDMGASVTPSVSLTSKLFDINSKGDGFSGTISPSITYNSRQGLQSMNFSTSMSGSHTYTTTTTTINSTGTSSTKTESHTESGPSIVSGSGSVSFLPVTFTPGKRLAMKNTSVRYSASLGPDLWGAHVEASLAGYASVQKLAQKERQTETYGYENSEYATKEDILDFNREKEQSEISKLNVVLPVTNYTYDLYTIKSQTASGMFRAHRGQVGFVFDSEVVDESGSNSFGGELEGGAGAHAGLNFRTTNTTSHTGVWNTVATPYFEEKTSGNAKDYERVYFTNIGENRVDSEYSSLFNSLNGNTPIALQLDDSKQATNAYRKKTLTANMSTLGNPAIFIKPFKREHRELRNQVIQKITKATAQKYGLSSFINYNTAYKTDFNATTTSPLAPGHHTAGFIVTDENGSRHIFGETAYNKDKQEVTFNVGNKPSAISHGTGLVRYKDDDDSYNNSNGRDHYFNRTITPAYAHTYLITSDLSADYSDLTGNGPTDDDMGSYTKFVYKNYGDYQWRVPYGKITTDNNTPSNNYAASYNEGLKTDLLDQKGSYLYGVKENKYLTRIITKTHVAFINLQPRKDGFGVVGKMGGGSANTNAGNKMYCIKSISLYTKPEAEKAHLLDNNPNNDDTSILPIKTANFEYTYALCPGIENNLGPEDDDNADHGKLTLTKVYFTYRGSNMGKYTPYKFEYSENNPSYNVKAYDIWGNYKPMINGSWNTNSTATTPQEYPYVEQTDRAQQDAYAESWSLKSIQLPSGGKIQLSLESDDYKYVQDQKAMRMFKIDGLTNDPSHYQQNQNNTLLYSGIVQMQYVAIQIPEVSGTAQEIIDKFTGGLRGKPIYFNFLLNMTNSSYDYVTGYFEMEKRDVPVLSDDHRMLFVPMKLINMEGGSGSANLANPIAVAGCFFGRQNLNTQINDLTDPSGGVPNNIVQAGKSLLNNLDVLTELWNGANGRLFDHFVASKCKPAKSWIRLYEPTGKKIGGGLRVSKVTLSDEWNSMLINPSNGDLERYNKSYGQKYDYTLPDGTSSGVATYEPNISRENPLIVPLYNEPAKLTAQSYQEKPFGESFYPSASVTYSKVTVSNVTASGDNDTKSGKVVSSFYTSYDFPTLSDYTNLSESQIYRNDEENLKKALANSIKSMLGLKIVTNADLTMTQGFTVQTNDMNSKKRKEEVYNNANALISSVEYKYSVDPSDPRILKNTVPTVKENGTVSETEEIASTLDVVNDLRESYSKTESFGLSVNVDVIPFVIPFIVGFAKPESAIHKQILRTAVTTKVIHRCGILKETIVKDLGSTVYTRNNAWDAKTGQVLLTETVNEFEDKYYSFNFPAYWSYKDMGMAAQNIDITGEFNSVTSGSDTFFIPTKLNNEPVAANENISAYLKPGDELLLGQPDTRYWVDRYNSNKTGVHLISFTGTPLTTLNNTSNYYDAKFRVLRSGYRNQQMTSMQSVTQMYNPLTSGSILNNFTKTASFDPKVINASAIEYTDVWNSQCENGLPNPGQTGINPYLYNIRGTWRPVKSYAYLTGRNTNLSQNIRKSGFFKNFSPFYSYDGKWGKTSTNWTFASEVTLYNPYGPELENRDALNRYSSAQYGYNYTLPNALASNARYFEMGYDGFEDYLPQFYAVPSTRRSHFGFQNAVNANANIVSGTAHTGRKSIRVSPGAIVTMTKTIQTCPQ